MSLKQKYEGDRCECGGIFEYAEMKGEDILMCDQCGMVEE